MSDTESKLDALRQLDVDVDELLDAAVALAEVRLDVRTRRTETPLPPSDPGNLSRRVWVPAVEENDVDPVGLLQSAVNMVRTDLRPALALRIAGAVTLGSSTPIVSVREKPGSLFAPELAQHVLRLRHVATSAPPSIWVDTDDGPWPLTDARLLPLPSRLDADADALARRFLDDFADPVAVRDEIIVQRLSGFAPPPPPSQPVNPEDVPLGQVPPLPETEAEAAQRQADDAARLAKWWAEAQAFQAEIHLVIRHAAQRAVEKILQAAAQRPTDVLGTWSVGVVAERLQAVPHAQRVRFLAECLAVTPKTIKRALKTYGLKYAVRSRGRGHSSTVQCPRKTPKTPSTISPLGAESTSSAGGKRDTHDEQAQPQPPQTSREAVQLPPRRPARPQRFQRQPVAKPHRPERGPRSQARTNGPRPEE